MFSIRKIIIKVAYSSLELDISKKDLKPFLNNINGI